MIYVRRNYSANVYLHVTVMVTSLTDVISRCVIRVQSMMITTNNVNSTIVVSTSVLYFI